MDRMGIQRSNTSIKETSQVLYQYADLIANGVSPEDAMTMTAQTLDKTRKGIPMEQAAPNIASMTAPQTPMAPGVDMASGMPPEEQSML